MFNGRNDAPQLQINTAEDKLEGILHAKEQGETKHKIQKRVYGFWESNESKKNSAERTG